MNTEIKTYPGVGNNTPINKRNRAAQAYIDSHKKPTVRKGDLAIMLCMLAAIIGLVVGIIIKANLNEPLYITEGYYMETDEKQADGNYFVYVTERICEVTEINNDLITVEYNGNLYDFFGYGYEVGEQITCQFTTGMEIVGVVE